MPARCMSLTARAAVSGVCSAGLATTALPAASAPAICPVKMASGKFHGEIAANTPRPCSESALRSPVGPLSWRGAANCRRRIAKMIDRLAKIALGTGDRLAGFAHHQRHEPRAVSLEQIGGAVEQRCARLTAEPIPFATGRLRRTERPVDGLGARRAAGANHRAAVVWRADPGHLAALLHLLARDDRVGGFRARQSCFHRAEQRCANRRLEQRQPEAVAALRRKQLGGGLISGLGLSRSAAAFSTGSATMAVIGAASSASRLTKEVLAPFSRRRRTR